MTNIQVLRTKLLVIFDSLTMNNISNIKDLLDSDSFIRWVKGNSNVKETHEWEIWVRQSVANKLLAEEARFFLKKLKNAKPAIPDKSIELNRFQRAMAQSENQKQLWDFSEYNQRSMPFYIAFAASILIMIVMGIAIYRLRYSNSNFSNHELANVQEFQTDYGQKTKLRLSDGSQIILNANSKMKFANSIGKKRAVNVWLNGEAYFSIVHHTGKSKRIFVVHTKDGTITDIGTHFSVNTRSDSTIVALVQGQVNIKVRSTQSPNNEPTYSMKPSTVAYFKDGGLGIEIQHVNTEIYTSWISDKLVFFHTSLETAVKRIEATYGVKVVINEKRLLDKKISGTLRNNNLHVFIEALSKVLNVPIRQENNEVIIG